MTQMSRFVFGTFALVMAAMGILLLAGPIMPGLDTPTTSAMAMNESYVGGACLIAALAIWSRIFVATGMRL